MRVASSSRCPLFLAIKSGEREQRFLHCEPERKSFPCCARRYWRRLTKRQPPTPSIYTARVSLYIYRPNAVKRDKDAPRKRHSERSLFIVYDSAALSLVSSCCSTPYKTGELYTVNRSLPNQNKARSSFTTLISRSKY